MNFYLFKKLPDFKKKIILIFILICLDIFFGSISILMLIPIFEILNSNKNLEIDAEHLSLFKSLDLSSILFVFSIVLFIKVLINFIKQVLEGDLQRQLRHKWTLDLSKQTMFQSYEKSEGKRIGETINLASREILRAGNYVTAVLTFYSSCMYVIIIGFISFAVNWKITLFSALIFGLLYIVFMKKVIFISSVNGSKTLNYIQNLMADVNENIFNLKEIKILNLEKWRLKKINQNSLNVGKQEIIYAIIKTLPTTSVEFLFCLIILGTGLIGYYGIEIDTDLIIKLLPFYMVASYKIFSSFAMATSHKVKLINREPSFNSVCNFSNIISENYNKGLKITEIKSDIKLENISFSFSKNRKIFNNFTSSIKRNKVNFLLGNSGMGKSTLLDLITRLRNIESGQIKCNGKNIDDFRLDDWRKLFGYVSQDPFLFKGSLEENIFLDLHDKDYKLLKKVIDVSQLNEFLMTTNDGFSFPIFEKGSNLSGGQKRRVAIARALIRKPKILILDEATSSFEAKLEKKIIQNLKQIKSLTVILVTHRNVNIKLADNLIKLK